MSAEEVTVSLSRLALAKAIKTPDAGEEAEPWSKSIIFHQSHIDSNMRNSIVSPQQNKRRPGQRQQPLLHQNQKQQRGKYPHNTHHTRQDELYQQRQSRHNNLQQYPNQHQQQHHISQVNPTTNGNVGHTNIAVSKSAGTKSGRHIIPSDDEEENDEEEEEEEDEDEDEDEKEEAPTVTKNTKNKSQSNTLLQTREISEAGSKHEVKVTQQSKMKGKSYRQQPSDDEEEAEEEDSDKESDNDQDDIDSESDKDSLDNGHEAINALVAEENQKTYAQRMSTLRQLENGSSNPRRRSRSLSDMEQFTLPLAQIGEHGISLGQLNAVEEWQKTMIDVENITGSSASDLGSSALTSNEGDIIEEPIVSTNTSPTPSSLSQQKTNYRMSTLGEMDFYQYQQQQQQIAFHNMQMQQAMQMAQIQQYQQAMQMQQQMMTNHDPRMANNRQSVSAMDRMIQMEQEKSASRKTNKKKPINTSNVSLKDGLLSRVPEQRQHNFSFQGQMMSKTAMARASKSDYNLRESKHRSNNRPPSNMAMYYDNTRASSSMGVDPRMYSQMGRSESPMPTVSMSTPLQPMVGQYLSPNRGRSRQSHLPMIQPMMVESRSTSRSSHMPSSRQSTNWGSKSKERVR